MLTNKRVSKALYPLVGALFTGGEILSRAHCYFLWVLNDALIRYGRVVPDKVWTCPTALQWSPETTYSSNCRLLAHYIAKVTDIGSILINCNRVWSGHSGFSSIVMRYCLDHVNC